MLPMTEAETDPEKAAQATEAADGHEAGDKADPEIANDTKETKEQRVANMTDQTNLLFIVLATPTGDQTRHTQE